MLPTSVSAFNCSTEILFGPGVVEEVSRIINEHAFSRVLVVCDEGIERSGILDTVLAQIAKTTADCTVFSSVEPNPSTLTVDAGFHVLKDCNADLVIGVGGGSPLDTAKALALLATNGGDITDYEGMDKFPCTALPMIAIPTTAGTASEITIFTVITDVKRQYKITIGGRKLSARWAVVDPCLTLTLPPMLTAATGLDALVHAIESYVSKKAYPLSELLAQEAISVISANLRKAVYNPDNLEARTNMLYGSLVAGLAFNNTRLGNVHAMSHPLSAWYQIPHGIANSVLLSHVMEFNRLAIPEKFAKIAVLMGEASPGSDTALNLSNQSVRAVRRLSADIGIPDSFSEYKIDPESINAMADDAMKSGNIVVNPRHTTKSDLIHLYNLTI
ncbi:iron-containing alcohol dehydrogenase [Brevibacillus sp. NRS-1366]|uniref:iron-containing alcohol dehydrogenase n=1 Tax=Brevibacillus sp. NRS-1366 TaxID=3233899 RepID=UPI003D1B64EA